MWGITLTSDDKSSVTFKIKAPMGYEITEFNWARYLHYLVTGSSDQQLQVSTDRGGKAATITSSNVNVGMRYFKILVYGDDDSLGVLVDDIGVCLSPIPGDMVSVKSIAKVTKIFKKPTLENVSEYKIGMDHRGITISPFLHSKDKIVIHADYSLPFAKRLSPQELFSLYINNGRSISLTPDRFKLAPNRVGRTSEALRWKRIGDFFFVQAQNGSLQFTFAQSPQVFALNAVFRKINALALYECNALDDDQLQEMKSYLKSALYEGLATIVDSDPEDVEGNYVKFCVGFHDEFLKITGQQLVEDVSNSSQGEDL
jgi:hypothetical protein